MLARPLWATSFFPHQIPSAVGSHIICRYTAGLACSLLSFYLTTASDRQAFCCRMLGMVQTYNPCTQETNSGLQSETRLQRTKSSEQNHSDDKDAPGHEDGGCGNSGTTWPCHRQSETNLGYMRLDVVSATFCQYDNIFRNKHKGGSICFSSQFQRPLAPLFLGLCLIQSSILAESMWLTKWLTSHYTESREEAGDRMYSALLQ